MGSRTAERGMTRIRYECDAEALNKLTSTHMSWLAVGPSEALLLTLKIRYYCCFGGELGVEPAGQDRPLEESFEYARSPATHL